MADSPLFDMQVPRGMPLSADVDVVSNPLLPPQATREMLSHIFDEVYDLRPESHLMRLLGTLLGDAGVGQLRKRYTYTHIASTISTVQFYDLDRLFADVFGFRRFLSEGLSFDPATESGTVAEWEAVLAADASYRSRVQQFIRGVNWGPTVTGMHLVAAATIGHPVRIYEMFHAIDDEGAYDPGGQEVDNEYGDLEEFYYGELDSRTYGEVEGFSAYQGRSDMSRNEFIVRPLREISAEEQYHLVQVLNRLKPVGSMVTIDPRGVEANERKVPTSIYSPSNYWRVMGRVMAAEANAKAYPRYDDGSPVEQPRPIFSDFQGEEWFYNDDILSVTSYAREDGEVTQSVNYERTVAVDTRRFTDYTPEAAISSPTDIARGRTVRDGVLVSSIAEREAS